jgi:hypothetical protein
MLHTLDLYILVAEVIVVYVFNIDTVTWLYSKIYKICAFYSLEHIGNKIHFWVISCHDYTVCVGVLAKGKLSFTKVKPGKFIKQLICYTFVLSGEG